MSLAPSSKRRNSNVHFFLFVHSNHSKGWVGSLWDFREKLERAGVCCFFLLSDPHWWTLGHRNCLKTTAGKKRLGTNEKPKDHLGPIGL